MEKTISNLEVLKNRLSRSGDIEGFKLVYEILLDISDTDKEVKEQPKEMTELEKQSKDNMDFLQMAKESRIIK